jgi:[protein-PII] uridylyltransferase
MMLAEFRPTYRPKFRGVVISANLINGSPVQRRAVLGRSYRDKVLAHTADRLASERKESPADVARDLRTFLKIEGHRLKMAHLNGAAGRETAAVRSFVVDLAVQHAFSQAGADAPTQSGCALIAIGGYGRAELAPYSDVDLLFLYSGHHGKEMKPVLEQMLRLLWDARITVGHSFRTVSECLKAVRADPHFQTAMVQPRLLAGNRALYNSLIEAFEKDRRKRSAASISAIRLERDTRYGKFGASVFLQEPNIKESAGGLRDYHTALWTAHARHGCNSLDEMRGRGLVSEPEAKRIKAAYDFLWRLRHSMHFMMKCKTERLSLDIQPQLAREFGYGSSPYLLGSEKLMRDYYRHARELHLFSEVFLAQSNERGPRARLWGKRAAETAAEPFVIREGHLQFDGDADFFKVKPAAIFNAFALAQAARVPLDHRLGESLSHGVSRVAAKFRAAPDTTATFLRLLQRRGRAGYVLRLMHDAGVLARLIPEFRRISLLVQHDLYHHYTVDEHTLKAAEALDDLHTSNDRQRSQLRAALEEIEDPALLYLAVLLHDIGKGRGRGHIARGTKLAEHICRRLALEEKAARKVILLVQHHVTMAHLAQRRDLNESQVIADFAAKVETLDSLNMLLLLTYADLNAVGPGVWTEWKGTLLWSLYRRTRKLMTGKDAPVDDAAWLDQSREEIAKAIGPSVPLSAIERHLALLPERYLRITAPAAVAIHLQMVDDLKTATVVCGWQRQGSALTELTVCGADRHGLVADLAGTLAAHGIEILSAELNTREDGIAIDVFLVRQASTGLAIDLDRYPAIERALGKAVAGELDVAALVERWRERHEPRRRKPAAPVRQRGLPRVICDNEASVSSTLVEVHARDETGLVHKITRTIAALGIDIVCARIATEKSDALDVFYVTGADGDKLAEDQMRALEETLTSELSQTPALATAKSRK